MSGEALKPTREEIDAWLEANCGRGLPYDAGTDEPSALHGLAYILRQIEGTDKYKVHIGQCGPATSSLRWALDQFAIRALSRTPSDADRTAVVEECARVAEDDAAKAPAADASQQGSVAASYNAAWESAGTRIATAIRRLSTPAGEDRP